MRSKNFMIISSVIYEGYEYIKYSNTLIITYTVPKVEKSVTIYFLPGTGTFFLLLLTEAMNPTT